LGKENEMPAEKVLAVYAVYDKTTKKAVRTVTAYSHAEAEREANVVYPHNSGVDYLYEALNTPEEV
jgi:hypothetical protein